MKKTPRKKAAARRSQHSLPLQATVSLQIEKQGPVRTSERKHMPPKRYQIDLITKKQGLQENEEK